MDNPSPELSAVFFLLPDGRACKHEVRLVDGRSRYAGAGFWARCCSIHEDALVLPMAAASAAAIPIMLGPPGPRNRVP